MLDADSRFGASLACVEMKGWVKRVERRVEVEVQGSTREENFGSGDMKEGSEWEEAIDSKLRWKGWMVRVESQGGSKVDGDDDVCDASKLVQACA